MGCKKKRSLRIADLSFPGDLFLYIALNSSSTRIFK